MADLLAMAEAEVHAAHAFFVDWFRGQATPEDMEKCARCFADQMQRIGPEGAIQNATQVTAMVRNAQGQRDDKFSIQIEILATRQVDPEQALVIYDEHQQIDRTKTHRRSTALFAADAGAPRGVVWLHLHETWVS